VSNGTNDTPAVPAKDRVIPLTVKGARPVRHGGMSRREAMQWVMGAVAASALAPESFGQEVGRTSAPQELASRQPPPVFPGGYGTDPKLVRVYKPGEFWPLTFTDSQRLSARVLADTILPKDALGPAASEVGVVEMIDEWISAPYPIQQADRPAVVDGLAWLDTESVRRFQKNFVEITDDQRRAICDDICYAPTAKPEFGAAAGFFSRFRSLCASAYYATPAGWEAIGYVGNVALERFDGPPAEVLEKLGVAQTVG
jgi:hypothetical protein